jgi:hypothetical protein
MNEREENGEDAIEGGTPTPSMQVIRLGKDGPEEVGGLLGEILGNLGGRIIDEKEAQRGGIPVRPAGVEEFKWFMEGDQDFSVGDIVRLRSDAGPYTKHLKFPKPGDEVIVSGVEWGRRMSEEGAPENLEELCVLMRHFCGNERCKIEGTLTEYFYDRRLFEKVGNIYDGDIPKPWTKPEPEGPKLFPMPGK